MRKEEMYDDYRNNSFSYNSGSYWIIIWLTPDGPTNASSNNLGGYMLRSDSTGGVSGMAWGDYT